MERKILLSRLMPGSEIHMQKEGIPSHIYNAWVLWMLLFTHSVHPKVWIFNFSAITSSEKAFLKAQNPSCVKHSLVFSRNLICRGGVPYTTGLPTVSQKWVTTQLSYSCSSFVGTILCWGACTVGGPNKIHIPERRLWFWRGCFNLVPQVDPPPSPNTSTCPSLLLYSPCLASSYLPSAFQNSVHAIALLFSAPSHFAVGLVRSNIPCNFYRDCMEPHHKLW